MRSIFGISVAGIFDSLAIWSISSVVRSVFILGSMPVNFSADCGVSSAACAIHIYISSHTAVPMSVLSFSRLSGESALTPS